MSTFDLNSAGVTAHQAQPHFVGSAASSVDGERAGVDEKARLGSVVTEDRAIMAEALVSVAPSLAGRTLLVTGARGMLPAYILQAIAALNESLLADNPCKVIALSRSAPQGPLADEPHMAWLRQDVREPLPASLTFDWAIHAASAAAPRKYLADPVGTLMANAQGLHHVLERARAVEARGVLFFSSGELYGSPPPEACPTPETFLGVSDPRHPRGCYVEGKRFGEALAMAYGRQFGVPVKVVRPFQVFGPGLSLDDGRAFADFLSAAARGEDIELRSAGQAVRSYCYIADATAAFIKVLVAGAAGSVFNVGASEPEVTIRTLAETIARLGGRGSRVVFAATPGAEGQGSPARTCPSVAQLGAALGWAPTTSLEEGLMKTMTWLRESGALSHTGEVTASQGATVGAEGGER